MVFLEYRLQKSCCIYRYIRNKKCMACTTFSSWKNHFVIPIRYKAKAPTIVHNNHLTSFYFRFTFIFPRIFTSRIVVCMRDGSHLEFGADLCCVTQKMKFEIQLWPESICSSSFSTIKMLQKSKTRCKIKDNLISQYKLYSKVSFCRSKLPVIVLMALKFIYKTCIQTFQTRAL